MTIEQEIKALKARIKALEDMLGYAEELKRESQRLVWIDPYQGTSIQTWPLQPPYIVTCAQRAIYGDD